MTWEKPFIIVRRKCGEAIEILHQTDTLKMARYWLQNLAQVNDAIFTTSSHTHYKGDGTPTYMCHLVNNRRMEYNSGEWRVLVGLDPKSDESEFKFRQTSIIDISKDTVENETQREILNLLNMNEKQLSILLSKVATNSNWQSFLTLENKSMYLVSLNSNSMSPLTISLNKQDLLNIEKSENSNLKFVITPRTVL